MTGTPPCPGRDALERLLLGDMPDEEMQALEGHVARCPRCLEVVRTLQAEDALVEAVRAGGRGADGPGDEVDAALVARLCRLRPEAASTTPLARDTPPPGPAPSPDRAEDLPGLLAPPAEPDELGRLGPYGILRVLGSGGTGVVFAARQTRPRRVVALKMILSDPDVGGQRLERFRAESEIIVRLRHPHIVQVYEVGEHQGRPYFTMEYADGGSLAQKLAAAPLAPPQAAGLIEALARAVHAAHDQGVVHRDLKPSNVLLFRGDERAARPPGDGPAGGILAAPGSGPAAGGYEPKVADFGLAKQVADAAGLPPVGGRTETGAILGTPGYMAPEQAVGQSKAVGPAADVYALGALLYECLTGRPPFRAASVLETLEQVRSQEPLPPGRLQPKLPRDLETVCLKCLEKAPARRYASARELAEDLARFRRGEPIRARPVSWRERLAKWGRRRPALAALLAVSGLSLLVLVAGVLVYNAWLQAAVQRAQAGEARARQQQRRADAAYRSARDALDRMLQRLERRRLGEVPQLKELQLDQRGDALLFYQGILAGADDPDPEVRLDAAQACERAANIQVLLGRPADAAANFGRAIDLVEALPADRRDRPEAQALLASCYGDRGLGLLPVWVAAGRLADAERDLGKALDIYERLARARPDDPARQEDLARTEHQLGQLVATVQRSGDAERHYARAVALRTALVRDHPQDKAYQGALAEDYVNLGAVYATTERRAEAGAAYEKVEALLRPLVARHPDDVRSSLALAAADINWSLLLADTGQPQAALTRGTQAVDLAEAALRREPALVTARATALNAHGARAQVGERLGRWAEAVKDWDRVLELNEGPQRWLYQLFRALDLARAGDHARAAAEARALQENPEVNADGLYKVAAAYALCVGPVRADEGLPPGKRDALAERYASQAVALLAKLQGQGYFQDAGHAEALRTDEDLRSLRRRDDVRRLLEAVGKK